MTARDLRSHIARACGYGKPRNPREAWLHTSFTAAADKQFEHAPSQEQWMSDDSVRVREISYDQFGVDGGDDE